MAQCSLYYLLKQKKKNSMRSFLTSFSQTTKILLYGNFLIMEWFIYIFDDLCWNRHVDWLR